MNFGPGLAFASFIVQKRASRCNRTPVYRIYTEGSSPFAPSTGRRSFGAIDPRCPRQPGESLLEHGLRYRQAHRRTEFSCVVDQFTRECIAVAADRSMSSAKVAEALTAAVSQ